MIEQSDLHAPLSFRAAFRFPVQNRTAVRNVLIGSVLLLIPVLGFALNMGFRLHLVHHLLHGRTDWPRWGRWQPMLLHGLMTTGVIFVFHLPALALATAALWVSTTGSAVLAVVLGVLALVTLALAMFVLPGFMTFFAVDFDASKLLHPGQAARRALTAGPPYWKAWAIGLAAGLLSFLGFAALGIGFAVTSVWFWQVAALSFASAFAQSGQLTGGRNGHRAADPR